MKRVILVTAALTATAVVVAVLLWPSSQGPATSTVHLGRTAVTLTVHDPKQGANTVEIAVTDETGRPVTGNTVDTVTVELVMPQMGHALPLVTATPTGPGHYHAPNTDIPMPGVWEVTVSLPDVGDAVFSLPVT